MRRLHWRVCSLWAQRRVRTFTMLARASKWRLCLTPLAMSLGSFRTRTSEANDCHRAICSLMELLIGVWRLSHRWCKAPRTGSGLAQAEKLGRVGQAHGDVIDRAVDCNCVGEGAPEAGAA